MRPIDADALKVRVFRSCEFNSDTGSFDLPVVPWHDIEDAETLDYAPVRHGEWEERTRMLSWCDDDVDVYFVCSACKEENYGETLFCPCCGALMDGGKKDG